jgi:hypothetical protein
VTLTSSASAVSQVLPPQESASALPPVVNGIRRTMVSMVWIFMSFS